MRGRWNLKLAACLVAAASMLIGPSMAMAAAGVTMNITTGLAGRYTGTVHLGTVGSDISVSNLFGVTPGTGIGHADKIFADTRTLAASATENLDLAGVLTDPLGATITCVKVKFIYFKAAAGNTNDVVVGGAASNAFVGPFGGTTPTVAVRPGGVLMMLEPGAGWTVTAGTGDLLTVTNSSGTTGVTYDVIIGCASA